MHNDCICHFDDKRNLSRPFRVQREPEGSAKLNLIKERVYPGVNYKAYIRFLALLEIRMKKISPIVKMTKGCGMTKEPTSTSQQASEFPGA